MIRRPLVWVLALSFLTFSSGLAAGWVRWSRTSDRSAYRWQVIHEHTLQGPGGGTLVLGDSLVERQRIEGLCGQTVNAGVGSARVRDLLPHVAKLVAAQRPERVVINVGVNDVATTPLDQFHAEFEQLLAATAEVPVLVVGVPRSEPGAGPFDETVRNLVRSRGAAYLPYPVDQATGTLSDGLHLNGEGARQWQRAVAAAMCGD